MARTAFITGASGFIGGRLATSLIADGWTVRALARSEGSEAKVAALGCEPVRGDIADAASVAAGAAGAEVAFHSAAALGEWGKRRDFEEGNVAGTENALAGCREAGVGRFIHVGTEAALLVGEPLVRVDEAVPVRPDSKAHYSATKAAAELAVRAAAGDGFETVVVRPRLVWGVGDTTLTPEIVKAAKSGKLAWLGGGGHLTSTTHVDNVVHGLRLGAEVGRSGEAYFVTDGEPVVFREFITELLDTQGVEAPPASKSLPKGLARAVAAGGEGLWKALPLPRQPPLTRLAFWLSAMECTIDISKARSELGYEPVKSISEGMAELRAETEAAAAA